MAFPLRLVKECRANSKVKRGCVRDFPSAGPPYPLPSPTEGPAQDQEGSEPGVSAQAASSSLPVSYRKLQTSPGRFPRALQGLARRGHGPLHSGDRRPRAALVAFAALTSPFPSYREPQRDLVGARGDTGVPEGISQRWPHPPDGVPQQRSPKLGAQMPPLPSVLAWAQASLSQEQARVLDQGVPDVLEFSRRDP